MIRIRLSRFGRRNRPSYRIVVSDTRKDTKADYLENLGYYDPVAQPKQCKINKERVEYWLSVGAQMSPTVHNLMVDNGVIQGPKVKATKNKHQQADEEQAGEGQNPEADAEAKAESSDTQQEQGATPEENTGDGEAEKEENKE